MKKLLATITTVAALTGGAAVAQMTQESLTGMQGSLTQIEQEVSTELARLGIDADTGGMTLDQITEAFLIFEDQSLGDQEKRERITAMME